MKLSALVCVVPEIELLHARVRLLDEALDRGPVAAAERAEAALGKGNHRGWPMPGAQADVDGLGEDRVGAVRVPAEEDGIPVHQVRVASIATCRTQPIESALCVTSHRIDTVPTLLGAKKGLPARQRAAVGEDPLGRSVLRACVSIGEQRR